MVCKSRAMYQVWVCFWVHRGSWFLCMGMAPVNGRLFSPLPTRAVRALHFYREKISALCSLVDLSRTVLTHTKRSQQLLILLWYLPSTLLPGASWCDTYRPDRKCNHRVHININTKYSGIILTFTDKWYKDPSGININTKWSLHFRTK